MLLSLLSTPTSGSAAGWTQEFGKVIGTHSNLYGFTIYLDPQVADNVNNCATYYAPTASGWVGRNLATFIMLYPAVDTPSEAQKVMISQVSLATATSKPIKIYSSGCNSSTSNNVDNVWLKLD